MRDFNLKLLPFHFIIANLDNKLFCFFNYHTLNKYFKADENVISTRLRLKII
jgi:hypothetical protein